MNVTYKLDLCYKTKNDRAASPNRNKEYLKNTAQKPTMSKEELKSVCNLLSFEDYLEILQFLIIPIHHPIQRNAEKKCRIKIILKVI